MYANNYWKNNFFENQNKSWEISNSLTNYLGQDLESTQNWFSDLILKGIKIYPYFWFHYLFYKVVSFPEAKEIWQNTLKISSGEQSIYLRNDPLKHLNIKDIESLGNSKIKMLKFDRRSIPEIFPQDSILEFLYRDYLSKG